MKEEARVWIIKEKIGILSKDDLVSLADQYIQDHDDYPDWMLKISMSETLEREDRLDLVMNPVDEKDSSIIAKELLSLYESGELSMSDLAAACHKMYLSLEWGCDAFNQFIWISDEVHLIEEGIKPLEGFEENARQSLKAVVAI